MNPLEPLLMALVAMALFIAFIEYASSLKAPRRRHRRAH